mmetsp:Transcript_113618/g.332002  ORF Transcript_113618/g.332002 Transcript_113618/m.332002 type:complete len:389 (-) Transcript_113618:181-1347(-)
MAQVDPVRRRLSLSTCTAAKVSDPGPLPDEDIAASIEQAGLATVFEKAKTENKKVALVASVTDMDPKRRKSFADKDTSVLSSFSSDEEATQWVHSYGIGWKCKKGLKPELPNQDSFSLLLVEGEFALYCVYDGHGPLGHDVSQFVRETIVKLFIGNADHTKNPKLAFEKAFIDCQKLLEQEEAMVNGCRIDASMSGTTVTMAYHDIARDRLTIAHCGDSRGVLGGNRAKDVVTQDLTRDHKPNDPEERKRIETADPPGRVVFDGYYNHRVFAKDGVFPGLNMSRAMGDVRGHKEAGLSAWPDVKEIDLQKERKAVDSGLSLLLCTDGVWEFIKSEEAMQLVLEFDSSCATDAIAKLVGLSWDRWMQDSENTLSDDITGIVVDLSQPLG